MKKAWPHHCHCACGCERRTIYGICSYCKRGAHALSPQEEARVERLTSDILARERTACTVCERPFKSYQLEPGTGRCPDCMP